MQMASKNLQDLKAKLKEVRQNETPSIYQCKKCYFVFHDSIEFNIHMDTVHSEKEIGGLDKGQSEVVVKQRDSVSSLDLNSIFATPPVLATPPVPATSPVPSVVGRIICDECGKSYSNTSNCNAHKRTAHPENPDKVYVPKRRQRPSVVKATAAAARTPPVDVPNRLTCKDCGKSYSQPASLYRHRKQTHRSPNNNNIPNSSSRTRKASSVEKQNFDIKKSPKRSSDAPAASVAKRLSFGDTFFCEQCNRSFRKAKLLIEHLTLRHDIDLADLSLDLTNAAATEAEADLRFPPGLYMKASSSPKAAIPKISVAKLKAKKLRKKHRRRKSDVSDQTASFDCELCGREYMAVRSLRRHISHSHPEHVLVEDVSMATEVDEAAADTDGDVVMQPQIFIGGDDAIEMKPVVVKKTMKTVNASTQTKPKRRTVATQTSVEGIGEEAYFGDKEDNLEMDLTEGGDDPEAPPMFTLTSGPRQYYSNPPF